MKTLVIDRIHRPLGRCLLLGLTLVSLSTGWLLAEIKTESFDSDPNWESFNNRMVPKRVPFVRQNFGYSRTKFAATSLGEIGGEVWRASRPAAYGLPIPPRTLQNRLHAAGTFALTKTTSGSGIIFGWYRHPLRSTGRPMSSLAWYLDGEQSGARMMAFCVTGWNRQQGTFVTHYERGKTHLPLQGDGTRHTWSMSYDPQAKDGRGAVQVTLDDAPPVTMVLPEGIKDDPTQFNRFGLMNLTTGGGPFGIYLADLTIQGEKLDLSEDPHWEGSGNRDQFEDRHQKSFHDFGYSETNLAGGKKGEIGGLLWRAEQPYGYYADKIDTLSLEQPLMAQGRIVFIEGAPDSAAFLGFFNHNSREDSSDEVKNALGMYLEGPSRIGHYFRPRCATKAGTVTDPKKGPLLLQDGKSRNWKLEYDPAENDGQGRIQWMIGDQRGELLLPASQRAEGAEFNRFGLSSVRVGGNQLKIYIDDLQYTATTSER